MKWVGAMLLALGTLTGCAGGGGNTAAETFVWSAPGEAMMLQWSPASMTGTWAHVFPTQEGAAPSSTTAITVVRDGKSISITPQLGVPWSGTLEGDQLKLDIPRADGGSASVQLHRGTAAEYQEEVRIVTAAAQARQVDAEMEQAADEQADALVEAKATLSRDTAALTDAVERLENHPAGLGPALDNARAAIASQRASAKKVRSGLPCDTAEALLDAEEDAVGVVDAGLSIVDDKTTEVFTASTDVELALKAFTESSGLVFAISGVETDWDLQERAEAALKSAAKAREAAEAEAESIGQESADLDAYATDASYSCRD